MKEPTYPLPRVAIGGVGGSGTRLVAQLLRAAGFHLGDDLNDACDTLWFTLLFKRVDILHIDEEQFDCLTRLLTAALHRDRPLDDADEALARRLAAEDRPQHPSSWLAARAESLLAATVQPPIDAPVAWKEPNTHIVIERLWQRLPQLRYVHVVRNGVDMAHSSNQNQLRLWGPSVLGGDGPVTPARSLAYWCQVHQRMQSTLAGNRERMYWLDYDRLCREPHVEAEKLCRFLHCDLVQMKPVLRQVHAPAQRIGVDLSDFAATDIEYVRSLGYALD